ncbi:MAG: hypothetical protein PHI66_03195 [Candidatus Pacebacteria bacterium]|nr:hypothetical protein [Candidatus Paceibacterota bacterium]
MSIKKLALLSLSVFSIMIIGALVFSLINPKQVTAPTPEGSEDSDVVNGKQSLVGFGNEETEDAIIDYLLTQKEFSWQTEDESQNFCMIDNLGSEQDLFPLYIWARCGEFALKKGELKELSGVSVPIKIEYPNELSFYDINRFSHTAPEDGTDYSDSIASIFPEDIRQIISDYDSTLVSESLKKKASAYFQEEYADEEEVTISTDKTEYEEGEEIKIVAKNNLSKDIFYSYPESHFWGIEYLENGEWIDPNYDEDSSFQIVYADAGEACQIALYERSFPAEFKAGEELSDEWSQNICPFRTASLFEARTVERIPNGTYRFIFTYGTEISKEDPFAITDAEEIYSNEFLIK